LGFGVFVCLMNGRGHALGTPADGLNTYHVQEHTQQSVVGKGDVEAGATSKKQRACGTRGY
jgi:hypothetical protein